MLGKTRSPPPCQQHIVDTAPSASALPWRVYTCVQNDVIRKAPVKRQVGVDGQGRPRGPRPDMKRMGPRTPGAAAALAFASGPRKRARGEGRWVGFWQRR